MNAEFCLVLCSRNRSKQVESCLKKLRVDEIVDAGGEVVLVDSASDDGTEAVYRAWSDSHPEVPSTVVACTEPGLSLARNRGVAASKAPVIIFLEDDVYLDEGYFERAISLFKAEGKDLGVIGGRILRFDPRDSEYGCQTHEEREVFASGTMIRPGIIRGTNLCVRREAYQAVNGFDEDFGAGKRWRCEDMDLIVRVQMEGYQVVYEPSLVVYHHHGRRGDKEVEQLRRESSYSVGGFLAKMSKLGRWRYRFLFFDYLFLSPVSSGLHGRSLRHGWSDYRAHWRESRAKD